MQPSASSWYNQGTPVTSQDLHALDASSWMNVAHGPVNMGLSPVLSHESQSSHTFNSFSEPDVPFLPPGLDLSFIDEASWQISGHVAYPGSQCVPRGFSSSLGACPQHVPYGGSTGNPGYVPQSDLVYGPHRQVLYHPGAPTAALPRESGYVQPVIHDRPLLPRADESRYHLVPSKAGHAALQPRSPSLADPERKIRVSSAPGMLPESIASRPASIQSFQQMDPASQGISASPAGQVLSPCSAGVPVGMPALIIETNNDDFSSFIHYDQEEKMPATATRSEHVPHRATESFTDKLLSFLHVYGPEKSRSDLATPEQDVVSRNLGCSSTGVSVSSETDEGRYRNHPLYSEGPHSDGLYHCPFKSDPSCQHKATKLKCNYEYGPQHPSHICLYIPVL